jgi:hypothetical protein
MLFYKFDVYFKINILKKLYFILITLFFYEALLSQKIIEVTGQILNEKDNTPIHYASVYNIKKSKNYSCDSLGFFHVTMLSNDILRINALGFERQYFSVMNDSLINIGNIYVIKLKEKTYKIANIDIYAARWKDFEFEFSHTETEKQELKDRIEKWFYSLIDPKELALLTASTAIGIPINYKTKIEKQHIKVKELEREEIENDIIESKYNPLLVSEITGLNMPETLKFMKFCNFSRPFLINATEYDLIINIKTQFERYYLIKHR